MTKSHSRPYVSDDNPFSESQFKTLKYRPDFPENFGSQEDTRAFLNPFFYWYNYEHRHSGINMMTPAAVHYSEAEKLLKCRRSVMRQAFEAHPERFVKGVTRLKDMHEAVWINPPKPEPEHENKLSSVEVNTDIVVTNNALCDNEMPGVKRRQVLLGSNLSRDNPVELINRGPGAA